MSQRSGYFRRGKPLGDENGCYGVTKLMGVDVSNTSFPTNSVQCVPQIIRVDGRTHPCCEYEVFISPLPAPMSTELKLFPSLLCFPTSQQGHESDRHDHESSTGWGLGWSNS